MSNKIVKLLEALLNESRNSSSTTAAPNTSSPRQSSIISTLSQRPAISNSSANTACSLPSSNPSSTSSSKASSSSSSNASSTSSSNSSKDSRLRRSIDQPSHALVLWSTEKKTSVVPISDVQNNNNTLKEGQLHMVKFGRASKSSLFEAKILAIGNRDVCKQAEKQFQVDKNNSATNIQESTVSTLHSLHGEQSLEEFKSLEKKYRDLESVLLAQEAKYDKLVVDYEKLQKKHSEFLDSFKPDDKEKYLRMAKHTLALFGNQAEIAESHLVPLTHQFPMVMVQPMVVKDMTALLHSTKENSYIFRKIMPVLIPDLSVWSETEGHKELLDKFNMEIAAAYDFIASSRPQFTMKEVRQLLCQMVAESRRTKRKRIESESASGDDSEQSQAKRHEPIMDKTIELEEDNQEENQPVKSPSKSQSLPNTKSKSYEEFSVSDLWFED